MSASPGSNYYVKLGTGWTVAVLANVTSHPQTGASLYILAVPSREGEDRTRLVASDQPSPG